MTLPETPAPRPARSSADLPPAPANPDSTSPVGAVGAQRDAQPSPSALNALRPSSAPDPANPAIPAGSASTSPVGAQRDAQPSPSALNALRPSSDSADPFGLWRAPFAAAPAAAGSGAANAGAANAGAANPGAESFALPAGAAPGAPADAPSAVWTLALTSGPEAKQDNTQALAQLAEQVHAIEAALAAAVPRAGAFLSTRAQTLSSGGESFTAPADLAGAPPLPAPEADLAAALAVLDPSAAGSAVSYGLPAGLPANIDWQALYQRLSALFDSVNRQILHYAWVDTTLDGRLVARTTVNWGGDFVSTWLPGLSQELTAAHCRSLDLAMASRLAYLRAILTASEIAGKIALALTTPLGPLQALALAWQFIQEIVVSEQ